MKILLIITVMFIGDAKPVVMSQTMPSIEECAAEAHKMLVAAESEFKPEEKDKLIGYGAQCVVMLPQGIRS